MIRYRLQCNKGHEFETWFASSEAYDKLEKRRQLSCPDCGSSKVAKALMSPQVATSRRSRRTGEDMERLAANPPETPGPVAAQPGEEMQRQFLALMREVRKEVEKSSEYVGPRFAEEARKIHLEEAEARGIWGEATLDEAKELHEEGIDCLPLPRLPEDQN